ncbi:hypothetical protein SCHPADRAFT_939235 [Schizopora paradoxa]|uniref:Heterokaryon incompatibility domain-containing protein n=1 Tax=Schizopora paradoxa TaxID=27342 RepID=A0A0H2RT74_9AGAM|nr:hypothetical protein SCHPADRAFT_939235 [Schizopora paradoxa]
MSQIQAPKVSLAVVDSQRGLPLVVEPLQGPLYTGIPREDHGGRYGTLYLPFCTNSATLSLEQADVEILTAEEILNALNKIYGTSLNIGHSPLKRLLDSFVKQKLDFGDIYARVRSIWPKDHKSQYSHSESFFWEVELIERLSFLERLGEVDTRTGGIPDFVHKSNVKPRKLWDLRANRVIPHHYSYFLRRDSIVKAVPIDYPFWFLLRWPGGEWNSTVATTNSFEWSVTTRGGTIFDAIRKELLFMGQEYAWVDDLCFDGEEGLKSTMKEEFADRIVHWHSTADDHRCEYKVPARLDSPCSSPRSATKTERMGIILQERAILHPAVLLPKQADAKYTSPEEILAGFNQITNQSLEAKHLKGPLLDLLNSYILRKLDFGMIYARSRSNWFWRGTMNSEDGLVQSLAYIEREGDSDEQTRRMSLKGQTISRPQDITPRRLWDLRANRVIPYHYSYSARCRQYRHRGLGFFRFPMRMSSGDIYIWAVSHSWTNSMDSLEKRYYTPINGYEWPVPVPSDDTLDVVRAELLNLGAEYAWVDVLCLRQKIPKPVGGPDGECDKQRKLEEHECTVEEVWEANERTRKEEWKIDLPTIGVVFSAYASNVVRYMNGLGRALEPLGWEHDRHWLRRAWTLQETLPGSVIVGIPEGMKDPRKVVSLDSDRCLGDILAPLDEEEDVTRSTNLFRAMSNRISTNPVDKVYGIAMMLCTESLPVYNGGVDPELAWSSCVEHFPIFALYRMLFLPTNPMRKQKLPLASSASWRPSWYELQNSETGVAFVEKLSKYLNSKIQLNTYRSSIEIKILHGHRIFYKSTVMNAHLRTTCTHKGPRRHAVQVNRRQWWGLKPNAKLTVVVSASGRTEGQKVAQDFEVYLDPLVPDGHYTFVGDRELVDWVVCEKTDNYSCLKKLGVAKMTEVYDYGQGLADEKYRHPHVEGELDCIFV